MPHRPESLDRRDALKRLGAFAAGAAVFGCTGAEAPAEEAASVVTPRRIDPVGVQLYTVRSEMENGVEATLRQVAEIGYREVEFAGYFGHGPDEVRQMLANTGLSSPASHVPPTFGDDDWARILEEAAGVGHEYVVVAWIPEGMRTDLDAWRRTAEAMNRAGEQARAMGLQYAYHNHDFEFTEMDGQVAFDVFCAETDPTLVQIELDLFWITHAGHDPVQFISRWPGRVPMVHVKDRLADGTMVDVGAGEIDFAAIFQHIDHAGMKHFFVEHDQPDGPMRSIGASFDHLSAMAL